MYKVINVLDIYPKNEILTNRNRSLQCSPRGGPRVGDVQHLFANFELLLTNVALYLAKTGQLTFFLFFVHVYLSD